MVGEMTHILFGSDYMYLNSLGYYPLFFCSGKIAKSQEARDKSLIFFFFLHKKKHSEKTRTESIKVNANNNFI